MTAWKAKTKTRAKSKGRAISVAGSESVIGRDDGDDGITGIDLETGQLDEELPVGGKRINENKQTLSAKRLDRWQGRPNVHIAMHYRTFAEQYASLWHVVVLMDEQYHKRFKADVPLQPSECRAAAPSKDDVGKTIRFILDGACEDNFPKLTEFFATLSGACRL